MNTDENKERSATPNIQTIAQWDFIKLNSVKALIFDGEVEHWNQSGTPPKLEKLEEYWRRLIVDIDPQQREQNLANTLATLGEKIREVENKTRENESQESLNREKSPHCEQVYAAIDRSEVPPGAVVTAVKAENPNVVWPATGEDGRRWQLLTGEVKPHDQIRIRKVADLRYERADLQRNLSQLIKEIDFFKTKAEIEQIPLPKESETQAGKSAKRRGLKGPSKKTTVRRSTIKILRNDGITGRRLCEELDKRPIPLPTDDLNFTYEKSWVRWFDSDKVATQRQLSADFTRP